MGKQKKKPQHDGSLKDIVYATAIANLIEALIRLIRTLLE